MNDIFLKFMLNILKNYMNSIMIYHFYLKKKIEKVEKLLVNLHDKTEYVIHITQFTQFTQFKTGIKSWISFLKSLYSD